MLAEYAGSLRTRQALLKEVNVKQFYSTSEASLTSLEID